jgi:OOP family OmpA-OmpF porin
MGIWVGIVVSSPAMRNLIAVLMLLGLCLPTLAQTNPQDRKGCVDSKVLSRISGCFIYSCRVSDYDAAEFRIQGKPNQKVEGAGEVLEFHCAPQTSRIEIIRNVERALKSAGFTIRYQMDGANWSGITGQKGPQWVGVQSGNATYRLQAIRAKELEQQMEANADGWSQQIEQTGRVSIYGINFDTGKATVRSDSEKVLGEVLALLQKNAGWRLAVTGHTDNVGGKAMNLTLSRQRAQSVVAWLTAQGIEADRLLAGGFGDLAPVADNATEDGRAKNRRVDLIKLY